MRYMPLFVFLALALFLGAMLLHQATPRDASTTAAPTALPALTLKPATGKTPWDQAATLRGHVTLINFFASWCGPCAAEMPELLALKKQFPDVQIIGVAWNDEPQNMQTFLKQHGNPFTSLWFDPTGDATMALGIKGIPESFILDRDGMIRDRISSPLTEGMRTGPIATLLTQLQSAPKSH